MFKKIMLGLLVISLLGLLGITEAIAKKIEIKWLVGSSGYSPKVQESMKNAFEKEHPDYTLTIIAKPGSEYIQTVKAWATAHKLPDIFVTDYGWKMQQWIDAGIIMPIDDLIEEAGLDLSSYPEWSLERARRGGKLYGLPSLINYVGFINYNKKLFDEAGIPYPTKDMTWDELADLSRKLTIRNEKGEVIRYGVLCKWPDYYLFPAFGGRVVDDEVNPQEMTFGHTPYIKGMKWYRDLVDEGVMMSRQTYDDWGGSKPKLFAEEKVAMIITGIGYAGYFAPVDFDVEILPTTEENFGFTAESLFFNIGSQCKHPEAAFELLRWISEGETYMKIWQTEQMLTNCVPPFVPELKDAFEKIAEGRKPANWKCFYDVVPYGINPRPSWNGCEKIMEKYWEAMTDVMWGRKSIIYLVEAEAECQKMLDELNKNK